MSDLDQLTTFNTNLERRYRTADSRASQLDSTRQKDLTDWSELSTDFSERIIHLEKLLAQECSKGKMMEQILRSGGLELAMEKQKEGEEGGEVSATTTPQNKTN